MKMLKCRYLQILTIVLLVFIAGCKKNSIDISRLYTPTSADVTATTTLPELQQGRALYINNCSTCHALASPDDYSLSQWKGILGAMAPRTGMSSSEVLLVTKYVSKGKQ
jgi:mono/diheme cytochrome c family protein